MCAILNGMAGIIVFSAPSALSSAWFPPNERTTATGVALVFNNLGNVFSFLAPQIGKQYFYLKISPQDGESN